MKKSLRTIVESQTPWRARNRLAVHAPVQAGLLENAGQHIVCRFGHGMHVSIAVRDDLTVSVWNKGLRMLSMVGIQPLTHPGGMNKTDTARNEARLSISSLAFVMTAILALFMLFLALRGFLVPHAAAVGFGIPIENPADLFYLRVKGDRDLSTALALIGLMALRRPLPLAIFITAAIAQPLFDCILVLSDSRGGAVQALSVHGSAVVYLIGLSLLLFREHRRLRLSAKQLASIA